MSALQIPVGAVEVWELSGLRARNLRSPSKFLGFSRSKEEPRYLVKISNTSAGSWNHHGKLDLIASDGEHTLSSPVELEASPDDTLKIEAYCHHTIRNESLGKIEATIRVLRGPNNSTDIEARFTSAPDSPILFFRLLSKSAAVEPEEPAEEEDGPLSLINVDANTVIAAGAGMAAGLGASWSGVLDFLDAFQSIGDYIGEIHPYAKAAWLVVGAIPAIVRRKLETDRQISMLVFSAHDALRLVYRAKKLRRENRSQIIIQLTRQVEECFKFIQEYHTVQSLWEKWTGAITGSYNDQIEEYKAKFIELRKAFMAEEILEIEIAVAHVAEMVANVDVNVQELAIDERLKDMRFAKDARYNTENLCLPGTRHKIFKEFVFWMGANPTLKGGVPKSIFLLCALPGTGKSTIANTIASSLEKGPISLLGASFCFSRDKSDCASDNLFSTIARALAAFDKSFKINLFHSISDPAVRTVGVPSEQFERFIVAPMTGVAFITPIYIVIDGLDECAKRESILKVLSAGQFPPNLRFIITTSPEDDILSALGNKPHVYVPELDSDDAIAADIETYVTHRFAHEKLPFSQSDAKSLAKKADGLFQWAATACEYVTEGVAGADPVERFELVSTHPGLDVLYKAILEEKVSSIPKERQSALSVLARVLAAIEYLPLEVHRSLCLTFQEQRIVDMVIPKLGSLLTVHASNVIRPIHASFRQFLTDKARSGDFYVDLQEGHQTLAFKTFAVMERDLRFNICQFPSSHLRNSSLSADQVNNITPALSYSCTYWPHHLLQVAESSSGLRAEVASLGPPGTRTASNTSEPSSLLDEVASFVELRILYWLEVLSIKSTLSTCTPALRDIISKSELIPDPDLLATIKDIVSLANAFHIPISQSAPHIYLSALALSPATSRIRQIYLPRFDKLLHCTTDTTARPLQTTSFLGVKVYSVAFSPDDGRRIISGSADGWVRLWDSGTLQQIGETMKGHLGAVHAVAFSPNGDRIYSGSADETVRVWDAEKHVQIGEPLQGHQNSVWCISSSKDGQLIASGSSDRSIILWDAQRLIQLDVPLLGHNETVHSIAFSPDGRRLISASEDWTVRIWDVQRRKEIREPLAEHNDTVWSVAYSPDGRRFISSSHNRTIRVHDAETFEPIGDPLKGHGRTVWSVSFSQDGSRMVSCSHDRTIRIWDAQTLSTVAVLSGHDGTIYSVAISDDGRRVVSGSGDTTIRVWDVETQQQVIKPIEDVKWHTRSIWSVAWSRDGSRIVSGSADGTVRLWDSRSLQQICKTSVEKNSAVWSVAFSPDGSKIVAGSDDKGESKIHLWDGHTLQMIGEPLSVHSGTVYSVAFSPNGSHFISGSSDETIRLWDAVTLEPIGETETNGGGIWSIAYSPDGSKIACGSNDKIIRIRDAKTLRLIGSPLEGHHDPVYSVAFSPDGKRLVSGSSDNAIRVWDVETQQPIGNPLKKHTKIVYSVSYSICGRYILSASADETIMVWDATTFEPLGEPLLGHRNYVTSLALSSDGNYFASGSHDNTIRVWDMPISRSRLGPIPSMARFDPFDQSRSNISPQTKIDPTGWVLGPEGELLFWIPGDMRGRFPYPCQIGIIGQDPMHQFDASGFVHGKDWVKCKKN